MPSALKALNYRAFKKMFARAPTLAPTPSLAPTPVPTPEPTDNPYNLRLHFLFYWELMHDCTDERQRSVIAAMAKILRIPPRSFQVWSVERGRTDVNTKLVMHLDITKESCDMMPKPLPTACTVDATMMLPSTPVAARCCPPLF